MRTITRLLPLLALGLATVHAPAQTTPQDDFWAALRAQCGKAFAGQLIDPQAQDADIGQQVLVLHVRDCSEHEIRIPFHVGTNRSRTWVFTRTPEGLRLKHDHRHEDGSEDKVTQYGGDTRGPGTPREQDFHADAHTAHMLPASATNVWTVTVDATQYRYRLTRPGTPRRFEVHFDLRKPVPVPPPAWGAR